MIAPPGVKSIRMSLLPGSQAMTHMCPMSHMSIALSIRMSLHPGSQVMMKESVTVSLNPKEEEDLFVFNDTIEGPRAPAVKPGRITQA